MSPVAVVKAGLFDQKCAHLVVAIEPQSYRRQQNPAPHEACGSVGVPRQILPLDGRQPAVPYQIKSQVGCRRQVGTGRLALVGRRSAALSINGNGQRRDRMKSSMFDCLTPLLI